MSTSLLVLGEGHGEVSAAGRLVARVLHELGLDAGQPFHSIPPTRRMAILRETDLQRTCEVARSMKPSALLLTSDLDDDCPATVAPAMATLVRTFGLPFPVAVVLFHREYETLFVAAGPSMAGSVLKMGSGPLTLKNPVQKLADPESKRDAKGWVGTNLLPGKTNYKPTVHQKPFTDAVSLNALRASGLSSYRRLENGLNFLAREVNAGSTGVYP